MTVIIKYDEKGIPTFRSANGIGSSDEDRNRAKRLDQTVKDNLISLVKRLKKSNLLLPRSKANVEIYWELGKELRRIIENTGLIDSSELMLFWMNVNLHLPKDLKAKDRGPNRIHVEYCYRLSGLTIELSKKLNWGEWVFLFDSPTINKEQRFDKWFSEKLAEHPKAPNRDEIRVFAQCLNGMLGKLETTDLSDNQLFSCYEAAWQLSLRWNSIPNEVSGDQLKIALKESIKNLRAEFVQLIEADVDAKKYSDLLWQQIIKKTIS